MKKIFTIFSILCLCAAVSCKKEQKQEPDRAPEAQFTIQEDVLNIKMDDAVSFEATVDCNCPYVCGWYLDGELISTIENVTYRFADKGVFNVYFEAANDLGMVERSYTVNVTGQAVVVEYSLPSEEQVELTINDALTIDATVLEGDKALRQEWKVGEDVVSTTSHFEYTFTLDGLYTVSYYAENADGESASQLWNVKVNDLPLDIEFFKGGAHLDPGAELETLLPVALSLEARVYSGKTGLTHEWKVGDDVVSTAATLNHKFAAAGTYTLSYHAENAIAETKDASWTITVVDSGFLFDDFENTELGISAYYKGNNVSGVSVMQIVENPYKTSINPSSKVLVDKGSMMTWSSSGYFTFKINTYPNGTAIPGSERAGFTKVRVKVYVGNTGFTPLLQEDNKSSRSTPCEINGVEFNTASPSLTAWNAAIKTNDWNVFVYDFTGPKYSSEVNNLSQTDQLQFRVFVDFNNSGKMGADVYFDDFEFLE